MDIISIKHRNLCCGNALDAHNALATRVLSESELITSHKSVEVRHQNSSSHSTLTSTMHLLLLFILGSLSLGVQAASLSIDRVDKDDVEMEMPVVEKELEMLVGEEVKGEPARS